MRAPEKPARWTARLPLRVWIALALIPLAAFAWFTRYESSSGGECRLCRRVCSESVYGLDLFGKATIPLWKSVEWGPETRLSSELLADGHEHEPSYFSSNLVSRFTDMVGCGMPEFPALAARFDNDPDFRERVLRAVHDGQVSPLRAAEVMTLHDGYGQEPDPEVMRDAIALMRVCYGDDWDDVEVDGPASWILDEAEFLYDAEWLPAEE